MRYWFWVGVWLGSAAAGAECLPREPERVELRGTVATRDYPAPGASAAGRTQRVLLLQLSSAVCVVGDGETEPIQKLREVQLAFDWASAAGSNWYLEIASAHGSTQLLGGALVGAVGPEHRTPVVLLVDSAEGEP